jgi:voltage-gated potassium channel
MRKWHHDRKSVEASLFAQLREEVHRRFGPHRHSALLIALITAFVVRPLIGDTGAGFILFSIALVMLLLVALYNINVDELVGERGLLLTEARHRRLLGWILAVAAGVDRIATIFVHNPMLSMAGTISWLLFVVFIASSQLRSVLRQREVTGETICMAVSVYLLFGFAWALLYALIFQRHPEAFSGILSATQVRPTEFQHLFPIFGYFSLTTLSTIGFGDITPVTIQARYAAVAEGIAGQFYLAILVARLVGMQMSQSPTQHTENKTVDSKPKV